MFINNQIKFLMSEEFILRVFPAVFKQQKWQTFQRNACSVTVSLFARLASTLFGSNCLAGSFSVSRREDKTLHRENFICFP